jgi:hypothetical protein
MATRASTLLVGEAIRFGLKADKAALGRWDKRLEKVSTLNECRPSVHPIALALADEAAMTASSSAKRQAARYSAQTGFIATASDKMDT